MTKRARPLIRIALDLELESRDRLEVELIAARERIEALEAELALMNDAAASADMWQDIAHARAEQLEAMKKSEPVPEIGMTRDCEIGLIAPSEQTPSSPDTGESSPSS